MTTHRFVSISINGQMVKILDLNVKSPSFDPSLFHPQFECSHKVSEFGYCFMKLGNWLEDFQDLILARLDLMKNTSNMKM